MVEIKRYDFTGEEDGEGGWCKYSDVERLFGSRQGQMLPQLGDPPYGWGLLERPDAEIRCRPAGYEGPVRSVVAHALGGVMLAHASMGSPVAALWFDARTGAKRSQGEHLVNEDFDAPEHAFCWLAAEVMRRLL
jgi:hypothetical protein